MQSGWVTHVTMLSSLQVCESFLIQYSKTGVRRSLASGTSGLLPSPAIFPIFPSLTAYVISHALRVKSTTNILLGRYKSLPLRPSLAPQRP